MNNELTDDIVIARMRTALDEVGADIDIRTTGGTTGAADNRNGVAALDVVPMPTPTGARRRWIGVAAATLLLVGGATLALTRRTADTPAADVSAACTRCSLSRLLISDCSVDLPVALSPVM